MNNCGCTGAKTGARPPKPREVLTVLAAIVVGWAVINGEWKVLAALGLGVVAWRHMRPPTPPASPAATTNSEPPDSQGLYSTNNPGVHSDTVTVLGISPTIAGDC